MADKEKKAAQGSKVEKAATEESKAAEKVAKAAKGADKKSGKAKSSEKGGKVKDFFRHFKGETKKIVWPDAKTVLKSTGIVILVVAVAAIIIFAIDQGLGAGVTGLKSLANRGETTTSEAAADDHDEDESTTKADSSKESTTKAASSTEGTTAEKTSESKESSASEAAK